VVRVVRRGGQSITRDVYSPAAGAGLQAASAIPSLPRQDMHATFAHRTYSTNRRLPNVRKIKCKYIYAEIVPTTAHQYAGKQRNDWTNQIAAIERKACRLRNRVLSRSFSTFNRLENS